jgi:2-aminoadipate transaminase
MECLQGDNNGPMDDDGMVTDKLEAALRTGPKFIYVLPNFQNPTGVTLSLERRHKLIELADRYGVPIIEDDPYGQLRYEGEHLPSVVSLDCQFRENGHGDYRGNVIYLSTFSKILAPGLRLAWVIAPQEVIRKLVHAKQAADLHTATFNQMVAFEVSRGGFLDRHVWMIRRVYRERRDIMLEALQENFPSWVRWTHPHGGLFLWATMPEGMKSTEVLRAAIEQNVAFVPGAPFYPRGGGDSTMRINFSYASPDNIRLGISRLGMIAEMKVRNLCSD